MMIKRCGAVLQTGHSPRTAFSFLRAKHQWSISLCDHYRTETQLHWFYIMPWRSIASVSSGETPASSSLLGSFWSGHDKAFLLSANLWERCFSKEEPFHICRLKEIFFHNWEISIAQLTFKETVAQETYWHNKSKLYAVMSYHGR